MESYGCKDLFILLQKNKLFTLKSVNLYIVVQQTYRIGTPATSSKDTIYALEKGHYYLDINTHSIEDEVIVPYVDLSIMLLSHH